MGNLLKGPAIVEAESWEWAVDYLDSLSIPPVRISGGSDGKEPQRME